MPKATRVHSTPRRTASKTKPKSAVTRLVKSGLEIAPTKKTRGGKRSTFDDTFDWYANVDFKPWKNLHGMGKGELFPSREFLENLGVSCRIAYAIMLRSRDEMIASYSEIEKQHADELMRDLSNALGKLKAVREMVELAYHRVLASAAAAHKQGVKFKGDKPARRKAAS